MKVGLKRKFTYRQLEAMTEEIHYLHLKAYGTDNNWALVLLWSETSNAIQKYERERYYPDFAHHLERAERSLYYEGRVWLEISLPRYQNICGDWITDKESPEYLALYSK